MASLYLGKALRGLSATLFFSLLASGIAYLTRIVLARSLGPEEYGLFLAVFTVVIFFLFFRDLGLGQALVKYIAEFRALGLREKISTSILSVFLLQLMGSFILGGAFFVIAGFLAENYFHEPRAASILQLLILYILFSILFIITKHVFQGFQQVVLFSSVEPVKNLLVLLLSVLFLHFSLGVYAPVFAYVLVCPLLFLFYSPWLFKLLPRFTFRWNELKGASKNLMFFGLPLFASEVGGQIIGYLDTLMLTQWRSLAEVGVYNVVLPSALLFLFLSRGINAVSFPLVSELWAKKDVVRLHAGIQKLYQYVPLLVLPVMLTVFFFAELFLQLFFGEAYISGARAFQLLLFGVFLYIIATLNSGFLVGMGRPKTVTFIVFTAAGINVLLNLLLIPSKGITGAAFATLVSYSAAFFISSFAVQKHLSLSLPWKRWFFLLLGGMIFFLILFLSAQVFASQTMGWSTVLFSFPLAGLAYFSFLLLLKQFSWAEVCSLFRETMHSRERISSSHEHRRGEVHG